MKKFAAVLLATLCICTFTGCVDHSVSESKNITAEAKAMKTEIEQQVNRMEDHADTVLQMASEKPESISQLLTGIYTQHEDVVDWLFYLEDKELTDRYLSIVDGYLCLYRYQQSGNATEFLNASKAFNKDR